MVKILAFNPFFFFISRLIAKQDLLAGWLLAERAEERKNGRRRENCVKAPNNEAREKNPLI